MDCDVGDKKVTGSTGILHGDHSCIQNRKNRHNRSNHHGTIPNPFGRSESSFTAAWHASCARPYSVHGGLLGMQLWLSHYDVVVISTLSNYLVSTRSFFHTRPLSTCPVSLCALYTTLCAHGVSGSEESALRPPGKTICRLEKPDWKILDVCGTAFTRRANQVSRMIATLGIPGDYRAANSCLPALSTTRQRIFGPVLADQEATTGPV